MTRKLLEVSIAILLLVAASESFALGLPQLKRTSRASTIRFAENGNTDTEKTTTVSEDKEDSSPVEMKTWNPLRLLVLKAGLTEPMYTSPLNSEKREGSYSCAFCGNVLFDASSKYNSGSGWPSFWRSVREGAISHKRELDGRLECRCGKCGSHLGHTFPDGPLPTEFQENLVKSIPASDPKPAQRLPRFCVNGASLRFEPNEEQQQ
ncbi:Peptide methionine sulfoxide reductase MsrB [Seminavis robusta]|uniref:peptide-methionine (R)-S-oxide reductase n=1 Tax=Seminavis robusta TaxID=568900 RepID=A0A9N8EXJ8_9STRA|nr:Peptide methionine sulfoxide reductase MsrB [Seminavis robusta]|eukprot:Sro1850_g301610.1 Peptide methionine sulfoxide reductase MsrB (207) ;mRNA; f:17065-17685